ncbi:MAG: cytochrome-c oxidase, cbb3-type subunit III [Gammaproteobacteria bacterium]|nr:MAG: cytochrome-c oxidase, cbb3-type subunit III [Gammaproteobacteria bacterium]
MSTGWSLFVIIVTLGMLAGFSWLVLNTRRIQDPDGANKLNDHEFDGITEYDAPMPEWFTWMFLGSIAFALVYLLLYPGLGNFPGLLGWSSTGALEQDQRRADARFAPLFERYLRTPVEELAENPQAIRMGQRLFGNYCSQCHGTAAQGAPGYPNLTDGHWAWGGDPEQIRATLVNGRQAAMPAWGPVLGDDGIHDTTEFVVSLADRDHDAEAAARGAEHYAQNCVACHGPEGRGNSALGAADLTTGVYLYGGSRETIAASLRNGRNGMMPAQTGLLDEARIHILTAYVYGLPKRHNTAEHE